MSPEVESNAGRRSPDAHPLLKAEDLLAGSKALYEIAIPTAVLAPGAASGGDEPLRRVCIRPINIATLTLITRAARDDPGLVPLLLIKEGLVEPALTFDQIRQLHVGLVHFLVGQINLYSGLSVDGEALTQTVQTPLSQTHILLARHFGWTPEQVSQLTPGQVAVYLAGIEKLLAMEKQDEGEEG